MTTISVSKWGDRKYFYAQWIDPVSGRKLTRSTKKTNRRDAERWVARNEKRLLSPETLAGKTNWSDFRKRYEKEALLDIEESSAKKNKTTLNKVEAIINPRFIDSIDTRAVENFKSQLYGEGRESDTIITHMVLLRKALKWAHKRKIIEVMPTIDVPKRKASRRGRAITQEEFDRIIEKVPDVVGKIRADSWKFLLHGLWWGGMRLGEAMVLHWTSDENICIDMTDKLPMFTIQGHAEKGKKSRSLPMAPEFAQLIEGREQKGFVFNPERMIPPFSERLQADRVGKVISDIGEKANVKVLEKNGKVKFASAQDFRRSFGLRWAGRVLPVTLMELMRHESIDTTMKYYVGRNAQVAAQAAWDAVTKVTNTTANFSNSKENGELTQEFEA